MRCRIFAIFTLLLALSCMPDARAARTSNDTATFSMLATYYADRFVGRATASGDTFTQNRYTCAHYNIPIGTFVEAVNPKTAQRIVLKVNDRCPYKGIIDMTRAALNDLGIKGSGIVNVRIISPLTQQQIASIHNFDRSFLPRKKQTSHPPADKSAPSIDPQPDSTADTETDTDTVVAPPASGPRNHIIPKKELSEGYGYDLLLCKARSLHKAEQIASLLPEEYADQTLFVIDEAQTSLILHLAKDENDLLPIIEELVLTFPRIVAIKSVKF